MRTPRDEPEQKCVDDVEKYGWHVMRVLEDDNGPAFAYTIGLHHTFRHPELIVFGLPEEVSHGALNAAAEAVSRGARFSAGIESDVLFEDRRCTFRSVPESIYRDYFGWNLWFYDGPDFPALQVIWSDDDGRWPWDVAVDSWVRDRQPVLGEA